MLNSGSCPTSTREINDKTKVCGFGIRLYTLKREQNCSSFEQVLFIIECAM